MEEVSTNASDQIPIIDLSKLIGSSEIHHHDELEKLHFACREWAIFQLINHGVSEEVIVQMKINTQEFFQLPLEEKNAYAQLPTSIEHHGQAAFVVSERQKLDWGDMLFLFPHPASSRNLRFWPTNPTSFRKTLENYSWEVRRIAINLVHVLEPGSLFREVYKYV
ncbi:hypothetical protein FEM48_Zijuj11G0080900 [Ziziphus jujuba var. spinosa]|uniref:Non-haem dioxygenase N-terminal domain-containing protein n=1 Tax=Ziziphus jujuba var. spinosa TaxID=714518 RepID=A0A978UHS8_ZIZJJ|nr:hypothetical protein FEM48_Zijuj11G0080900 [Ziziphus jujuba var. spinosa]